MCRFYSCRGTNGTFGMCMFHERRLEPEAVVRDQPVFLAPCIPTCCGQRFLQQFDKINLFYPLLGVVRLIVTLEVKSHPSGVTGITGMSRWFGVKFIEHGASFKT